MPSTVLGKRTRGQTAEGPVQRVTRRSANNENENPFVRGNASDTAIEEPVAKKTRTSARTRLNGLETSPNKIDKHFKTTKAIEVYQDSKEEQLLTPKTPRHRDALAKKVPVTPRHRVLVGSQFTPRTPKSTPNHSTSVYNDARRLFSRCANPVRLVGRETERTEISRFLTEAVESNSGSCLYVSGPPGTGKSALIDKVTQDYNALQYVKKSVVNCMSVRNAKDLSQKLAEDLGLDDDAGFEYLKACFLGSKAKDGRKFLVILDEVDRLVDLDLELLYSLFEWSMQKKSRLILLGIANALDLTDRFLPRLKSRGLKPELLPFMPYTAAQIADVLKEKLRSLGDSTTDSLPFLHPAAIQFCAKKVASQTGDLRKAFDICRRAIDLVEAETREASLSLLQQSPTKTPLMENINLSSPPSSTTSSPSPPKPYTPHTAPKATIAHMARITAVAFSNNTNQRLTTLNMQQKVVLCSLSALEKRNKTHNSTLTSTSAYLSGLSTPSKKAKESTTTTTTAPSIKRLFEAYSLLCKRENLLHPLTATEFRDVLEGLETLGLVDCVSEKKGENGGMMTPSGRRGGGRKKGGFGMGAISSGEDKRVASVVGEKELRDGIVVEGAAGELLRGILEGDDLLGIVA